MELKKIIDRFKEGSDIKKMSIFSRVGEFMTVYQRDDPIIEISGNFLSIETDSKIEIVAISTIGFIECEKAPKPKIS